MVRPSTTFVLVDASWPANKRWRALGRRLEPGPFQNAVGVFMIVLSVARRNGSRFLDPEAEVEDPSFLPDLYAVGLLSPEGIPKKPWEEWSPRPPQQSFAGKARADLADLDGRQDGRFVPHQRAGTSVGSTSADQRVGLESTANQRTPASTSALVEQTSATSAVDQPYQRPILSLSERGERPVEAGYERNGRGEPSSVRGDPLWAGVSSLAEQLTGRPYALANPLSRLGERSLEQARAFGMERVSAAWTAIANSVEHPSVEQIVLGAERMLRPIPDARPLSPKQVEQQQYEAAQRRHEQRLKEREG